jgi:hypothetical protein
MNFIKKFVVGLVMKYLDSSDIKQKWIDAINKRIDLPGLVEADEAKLFTAITDAAFEEIKVLLKSDFVK